MQFERQHLRSPNAKNSKNKMFIASVDQFLLIRNHFMENSTFAVILLQFINNICRDENIMVQKT
jgi:hypothetical protein